MNKAEFLELTTAKLVAIYANESFKGFKAQVFAKSLGTDFRSTYDERHLWKRALFLASNSAYIYRSVFPEKPDHKVIQAFKEAAEIFELMSLQSDQYDRDLMTILSALCYDVAGYQANAHCLSKKVSDYSLSYRVSDPEEHSDQKEYSVAQTNLLLRFAILLLQKRVSLGLAEASSSSSLLEEGEEIKNAFVALFENIITGRTTQYIQKLEKCFEQSFESFDFLQNLFLDLIFVRAQLYSERSIWSKLSEGNRLNNPQWSKYIKLCTNNNYEKRKILPLHDRYSKFELWPSQNAAIDSGLLRNDESYLIQMPTSAGKTFIAELAILDALTKHKEKKCLYIAPFRALSNQIEKDLRQTLGPLGYTVSTISGNYEIDVFQELLLADTDVLVATPEKIDILLRTRPEFFQNISLTVLDEGHVIGDRERGVLIELLLSRLRILHAELRIILISAVLPDQNGVEFSKWLSSKDGNYIKSPKVGDETNWAPTKKIFGHFSWDERSPNVGRVEFPDVKVYGDQNAFLYRFIQVETLKDFTPKRRQEKAVFFPAKNHKSQISAVLGLRYAELGPTLVFAPQQRLVASVGNAICEYCRLIENTGGQLPSALEVSEERASYRIAREWFGREALVTRLLRLGVGVHYGDMPDAVRTAVEADYSNSRLKLLISTSTIAQGINFPVKYLVVHSFDINGSPENKLSLTGRDFWNLVGRAGRAGKETSGQVIALGLDEKDKSRFESYRASDKTESVRSVFIQVLEEVAATRLSSEAAVERISLYAEPALLNLAMEEVFGTSDEEKIEKIIGHSLFKAQIIERPTLAEHEHVFRAGLTLSMRNIRSASISESLRAAFAKTGFSVNSNSVINTYIESKIEILRTAIESDDHISILENALELFLSQPTKEIALDANSKVYELAVSDVLRLTLLWMNGEVIDELIKSWIGDSQEVGIEDLHEFIGDGLTYKLPWGVSGFLYILCANLNIEIENLPEKIRSVSAYLKYGTNSPLSCLLLSLGCPSRSLAKKVIEKFSIQTQEQLLKFVVNVSEEELQNAGFVAHEAVDIMDLGSIVKVTSNPVDEIEFDIRGTWYETSRRDASWRVKTNDILTLVRDEGNQFDPFAIKVLLNEAELGFVPREIAKLIAPEIDLNGVRYGVIALRTYDEKEFNRITVRIRKS